MTARDDLATLRRYLGKQRCSQEHHDALGAARRLEAELARLEADRDEEREQHVAAQEAADAAVAKQERHVDELLARAEAAEQREASLREALEQRRHVVTSQSSPGDPVGHDGFECDPDCDACAFAREVARLREGLRRIQQFQPNRLAWYKGLGIVFERAPGCAPTEWEAVAFWTYTDLCEIESIARSLLADNKEASE